MKRCLILIFLWCWMADAAAQKVGLVLSGGGAKGIAHVGVLKALEEHDIPIDYIVGTSMGGIIGGCYAAGMSPEQIEAMVLSEEFLGWVSGSPERGYNYFYHQNPTHPDFLQVDLALDSTFNFQLNSSIANDVSLNFALAEKLAQASVISRRNFDSLFVPLRVVAADIFTQTQVILGKGSLSDALRATQTVPFFYHPVRVDGKYLFDGGVYNNFPVDVAQQTFKPDVLIGVNVSSKIFESYPYDSDEKLISRSLLFLLLDKSDPSLIPQSGVFIQPNLKGYTSFDFGRARQMIDSGYQQTIKQIEEIKKKVGAQRTCEDVATRRNAFNVNNKPFLFSELRFQGFNSKQRGYIRRVFKTRKHKDGTFYYDDIKKGYFRLVSEAYFNNTYPSILFDTTANRFYLQLARRPQKNFKVDFGGVIATRDISNIFLGMNYYAFNRILSHTYLGFQTGNFYKAVSLQSRLDFPTPVYLEPYAGVDQWDFLQNDDVLKNVSSPSIPTVLRRTNRKFGVNLGFPYRSLFKGFVSIEGINNVDRFVNGTVFISTDTLDELRLRGFKTGLHLSASTLNRKQYASEGLAYSLDADYFNIHETFAPGSTSVLSEKERHQHHWFRLKLRAEQYLGTGTYRPGYYFEAVLSNQPFFRNYFGTMINAPAFLPLQDSPTRLLQNFRAFNYVAGGIRNVFSLTHKIDFRLEGYIFKPFEYLRENNRQEVSTSTDLKLLFFAGTAGFVYHAPVGPISLSVNYYDDRESQLGVLLHVGFLLFNKHSIDQ